MLGEGGGRRTMELLKDWNYLDKPRKEKKKRKPRKRTRDFGENPRKKKTNPRFKKQRLAYFKEKGRQEQFMSSLQR